MPMVLRLELDESEVPLHDVPDEQADHELVAAIAHQLGRQQKLGNAEWRKYARQFLKGQRVIFVTICSDEDHYEGVAQLESVREVDPAFQNEG